jgi:glycyl-tRNA synthetase beta chain
MVETKDLLFEIGCEELPPVSLLKLSNALADNVATALELAGLKFDKVKSFATPRRLAVIVESLAVAQPNRIIEKRGPAVAAAFSQDGLPSKAAEGFAHSCGTSVDQLGRLKTEKGEWLAFTQNVSGENTVDILPGILIKAINGLPIAKRMRWGSGETEFARPVHWIVLLFGGDVVECEILGKVTGNQTYGHRFHAPGAILVNQPDAYESLLYQAKVIAGFEERKAKIRELALKAAKRVDGNAHIDEDLLEEITAINEWPVPVTGNFDARFLQLPKEVLITSMQSNQKYFPVKDHNGGLLAHFITFSNIESKQPLSIQYGNERVILPRLADAEFFWNQDRKQTLEHRVPALDSIVFQKTLGSMGDKSRRVAFLAEHIATQLQADVTLAKRAALLAKTDLLTNMVGEFASLQGVMGRYYALADNEHEDVACAMEEQYFPKQSGGAIPTSKTGLILSLAEKVDTLCGIFSTGLIPTGDKDPYALRRATLGILRIVIEKELKIDVLDLIDVALAQLSHSFDKSAIRRLLIDFVYDRLKGYCIDKGYRADEFDSVIQVKPGQPLDFMLRLQAVQEFRQLPEAESLAAANKRIINILKKSGDVSSIIIGELVEDQEKQLLNDAQKAAIEINPLLNNSDYKEALNRLAQLRGVVDTFFDHVMVNTEDRNLRQSRLALLSMLSGLFLKIADISKLQA